MPISSHRRRRAPSDCSRTNSAMSVATWSLRDRAVCSLPPTGPDDLGQPALDRHVDVLVAGLEREGARLELGRDRVEARAAARRPPPARGCRPRPASPRAPWTGARRRAPGAGRSRSTRSAHGRPGPAARETATCREFRRPARLPVVRDRPDLHDEHRAEQVEAHAPARERAAAARVQAGGPACGRSTARPASTPAGRRTSARSRSRR